MSVNSEYVTRDEAARLLGVNVRTVDAYGAQGRLQKYMRLDRVMYRREDVELLGQPVLVEQQQKSTPDNVA